MSSKQKRFVARGTIIIDTDTDMYAACLTPGGAASLARDLNRGELAADKLNWRDWRAL